jgi:hypothetical protein
MTYQRHLITYEHLERAYLAGQAYSMNDDYFEDALVEAENRRQDHAKRTRTSVTDFIMDEATDCASMMPAGPARRNLQRRIGERTVIVALKGGTDDKAGGTDDEAGGTDDEADCHVSSSSANERSDDSDSDLYSK